jgi:hypothetical protein
MTPYQFIYGKTCHLPDELEHKAYWVIKEMNLDLDAAVVKRTKNSNKRARGDEVQSIQKCKNLQIED